MLAFPGCLKLEQVLTIGKDGSGTLDLSYSVTEQAATQIAQMLQFKEKIDKITGDADTEKALDGYYTKLFMTPTEEAFKREFKKYEKNGVTLNTIMVSAKEGKRSVKLKASFRSLAELQKADFFPQYGFSVKKLNDDSCFFFRDRMNRDDQTAPMLSDDQQMRVVQPFLSGFNVALRVVTPGKILKSNSASKALYTASWNFDLDTDADALLHLQNQQFKIIFDGKGMNLPNVDTAVSTNRPAAKPAAGQ